MRTIIALVALLLASGCAVQNVPVAPRADSHQPGVVNVYVIRNTVPETMTTPGPWPVTIDDYALCQLNPGEFTRLHSFEGDSHWVGVQRFQAWWHKEKDFFIAEPNGNYYFLAGVRDGDMFIERIGQETAKPYLDQYTQVCREPEPPAAVEVKRVIPEPAPMPEPVAKPMPVPVQPPPKPVVKPKKVAPKPVEVVPEKQKTKMVAPPKANEIFFDLDSAKLKTEMHPVLDAVVTYLRQVPSSTIVLLEGHACDLGTDQHNLDLSRKRAEAVRSYLLEKGIDNARIGLSFLGESKPLYDNSTEATRKLNRQVHLIYETDM